MFTAARLILLLLVSPAAHAAAIGSAGAFIARQLGSMLPVANIVLGVYGTVMVCYGMILLVRRLPLSLIERLVGERRASLWHGLALFFFGGVMLLLVFAANTPQSLHQF